ncbi:pyrophosphatase [Arthrobacter phage Tank]|uniref:MazG n=2 Tax=Tankvirus tank TaxID=1982567 RepID=A0A0U4IJ97_9CAUD|nr:pyrophosphatase [Arthrobacter phage Tank]ALY10598.1 MazG [Arthrobacter phage Tank]ALY10849.1 MazG [Arthrobacter phage Wilde]
MSTDTPTISETDRLIGAGQRLHINAAGGNSADHGFHDDWPHRNTSADISGESETYKANLRRAITEKLALIHEEISEALGEIRSGRDPLEIYYSTTIKLKDDSGKTVSEETVYYDKQSYDADGKPLCKPEGFLVELADANIRINDLVYLVDGEDKYVEADRTKRHYNTTRPYKHGRKF